MKILVVSGELISASICQELISEGHDVKLYIEKSGWKKCLDGIVPKTDNWKNELDWVNKDGLIVFDDVGFGEEQEKLRDQGYKVFGGNAKGDELEFNRELFQNLIKEHGLQTLPSYDFKEKTEVINFIQKHPDEWVVKQNAHLGVLNYVGQRKDGKDIIDIINSYNDYDIDTIHLQKKVKGIEIGIARYFNGQDWVGPIEINHEHKRLFAGDVGPLTHEMGTIMWYSENENLPIFEKTLKKFKPYLQKIDYRGDVDINCIVNEEGVWPLEATSRLGNPSTPLQCELHESSWADFLSAIATKKSFELKYKDSFGIVVCIAVPPFPYLPMFKNLEMKGLETTNLFLSYKEDITDEDKKHIRLEEISKSVINGQVKYNWSGTDGWVMHITAEDKDITRAQKKVYSIIDKIILPGMFYRTDIGDRVKNYDLPQLKKWGWI